MSKVLYDILAGPRATRAELRAWQAVLDDEEIAHRGQDYTVSECNAISPGTGDHGGLICTRWRNHLPSPYIAEGFGIYCVWEDDDASPNA